MNPYKFYLGIGLVIAGIILELVKITGVSAFLIGFGAVIALYGSNESTKPNKDLIDNSKVVKQKQKIFKKGNK
jgi:hypothetical protein